MRSLVGTLLLLLLPIPSPRPLLLPRGDRAPRTLHDGTTADARRYAITDGSEAVAAAAAAGSVGQATMAFI